MLLAKVSPGLINAPYVSDMGTVPVPSMTYSVNGSFSNILDDKRNLVVPGSQLYTVFLFMPVVSQVLGYTGDPCSGISIFQTNSL